MTETLPVIPPQNIEIGATKLYVDSAGPIYATVNGQRTQVTEIIPRALKFDKNHIEKGTDHAVILMKTGNDRKPFKELRQADWAENVPVTNVWGIRIYDDNTSLPIEIPMKDLLFSPPTEHPAPTLGGDSAMQEGMNVREQLDAMGQRIDARRANELPAQTNPPPENNPASTNAPPVENAAGTTPPSPTPTPETPPAAPPALTELQNRAQTRRPEAISVVGLNVRQSVSERAAKNVQEITAQSHDIFTKIWKGNIASELIREHQRQYVNQLKNEAHLMFSDQTYAIIEQRAQERYDREIKGKKDLGHTWTRFTDWVKSGVGGYTSKEQFAIDEVRAMYASGEIARIDSFEQSADAIQQRYETNFLDSEGAIRANLGEYVETFKADSQEHAMMMGVLTKIRADYLDGKIDDKEMAQQIDAFGQANIKGQNDLYTSSLTTLIKNDKALLRDDIDRSVLDAQFAKMDIRIGAAQMGESTQYVQSNTEKSLDWMRKRGILGSLIANEATAGTITALALTLGYLPRTALSSGARFVAGAAGGGAVAGTIAGLRKNAEMKASMYEYYRERERGGGLPQQGDKVREFFRAREIPLTDVNVLIKRFTDVAYSEGHLKTLSEDELTKTLAYLADAKARRAVSARGGENISLIEWGPAVDVARTNLDLSINKLELDLKERYGDAKQFHGDDITEWTKKLTAAQRQVLEDGQMQAGADTDPLKLALGVVSDSAPEIKKFRRKVLGVFGKEVERGTSGKGLNANLRELKTAIRYEAVNYGVKAGAIGTAIGTGLSELGHLVVQAPHAFGQEVGFVHDVMNLHPTAVPTHAIELPTLPHYTDLQGIDHMVQTQIPDHTNLVADATNHTFTLVNDHGVPLEHGIIIDAHGQITNADVLNTTQDAIHNGLHFSNLVSGVQTTTGEGGGIPLGDVAWHANQWDNQGYWGYIGSQMHGQHITDIDAAQNAVKNLFRGYEHYYHTGPNGVPDNVNIISPTGVTRILHYRDAHNWLGQGGKEPDWNHLPGTTNSGGDTAITNLPSAFGTDGIRSLGHLSDTAAKHYQAIAEAHQSVGGWTTQNTLDEVGKQYGQAEEIAAKIGYVGTEKFMPTQDEVNFLIHYLGGGGTPGGQLTTYTGLIDQTTGGSVSRVIGDIFTSTPAVAPLPREDMKPGTQPLVTPGEAPSNMYPVDMYPQEGDMYQISEEERLKQIQEREQSETKAINLVRNSSMLLDEELGNASQKIRNYFVLPAVLKFGSTENEKFFEDAWNFVASNTDYAKLIRDDGSVTVSSKATLLPIIEASATDINERKELIQIVGKFTNTYPSYLTGTPSEREERLIAFLNAYITAKSILSPI